VIRIGTSGFSYKEWLGVFYPAKLAGPKMLGFYARRMPAVEINYTFRAMPRRTMLEGWAAQVPAEFRFALKAPQRFTHFARLQVEQPALDYFVDTASALGDHMGPVLFQLPPDFAADNSLLDEFLSRLDGRTLPAFEFRHSSWLHESTFDVMRRRGAALCIAESEKMETPLVCTAAHAYLRLRKPGYNDAELEQWARRIRSIAEQAANIYVFFKHETTAPQLALKLAELLGVQSEPDS
jgi:uncharacterized protein YecE (DUF72 family)